MRALAWLCSQPPPFDTFATVSTHSLVGLAESFIGFLGLLVKF